MKSVAWDKLLQTQGFGSRKVCARLVQLGAVTVGGVEITDPALAVDPQGLEFSVDGGLWRFRSQVYLALNKPPNYECSRKPSHHPGVLTLLPAPLRERGVQPVGRLDHDTTGLLLLSDDGAFIHAQSSPKRAVRKVYEATTAEPVTDALIGRLLAGVRLHDEPEPLAAVECRVVGDHLLEIVVAQGKYHQVKRMLAAAGNHCAALCRTKIGGLSLAATGLAPGQWRYLEADDLALLVGTA